jgi:ectoine hydroxylase-related dioxygenase (phytanoyl-CoA dioxygenase family)
VGAPRIQPYAPPRFAVDDPAGYAYLEEHGYAVFKDVASPDQLEEGRQLAWDFLEGMPSASIKRNDPSTWNDNWPDPYRKGIIVSEGVGHSSFLWFNRALPTVQTVYGTIWQTPDLATSFDGFCMFRPFEYNEQWSTATGWFHLDQNGANKPDKICVQGFVNYYDSGETDGGLVVVPDSHKVFNDIFRNHPHLGGQRDFVKLEKFGPVRRWPGSSS